ncbi:hypothetical protein IF2G_05797 [Cordyceps javanica]|nr:hypothetical protein IF2G_05797 [Cordyceps javanica]
MRARGARISLAVFEASICPKGGGRGEGLLIFAEGAPPVIEEEDRRARNAQIAKKNKQKQAQGTSSHHVLPLGINKSIPSETWLRTGQCDQHSTRVCSQKQGRRAVNRALIILILSLRHGDQFCGIGIAHKKSRQ